jgi:hypothetical protein
MSELSALMDSACTGWLNRNGDLACCGREAACGMKMQAGSLHDLSGWKPELQVQEAFVVASLQSRVENLSYPIQTPTPSVLFGP